MNLANYSGKNLEICLSSDNPHLLQRNAQIAFASGATRIELCGVLSCGGLTPNPTAIAAVAQYLPSFGECIVMLRQAPHFFIDDTMLYQLQKGIDGIACAGATGIALGFIDDNQEIATDHCRALIATAKSLGLSVTFHRAFDAVANWQQAAETLLELGVERVLSAGNTWQSGKGAAFGTSQLIALLKKLNAEIEVVIAGGVNTKNAADLWLLSEFGPLSLHTHSGVHHGDEVCPRLVNAILTGSEKAIQ
ncbi:copper homeostasis protein CutC [Pseudoalteromonas maricaloris]|uniref:Copper homeostasis protein cutC homolog n=1 Tax=Pseudoalteromonas maricaloris TaxID=184924 RepID=A0A8I2KNM6_9GAMM|nr:copper homeostasis protein CutC [Pseudoalteromonas maricaloris]NLR19927.1 copper homeostasis protein CutC [Pseudoalteromonas maricaloris]WOX27487.1 copper homeostasis protein CutC [Pseudoalteromonas maricaloris]